MDAKEREKILKQAVCQYGAEMQAVVFMEELSELQKELSKFVRGQGDRQHIIEETADVMVMIAQLPFILQEGVGKLFEDVDKVIDFKIGRLKGRIENADTNNKMHKK